MTYERRGPSRRRAFDHNDKWRMRSTTLRAIVVCACVYVCARARVCAADRVCACARVCGARPPPKQNGRPGELNAAAAIDDDGGECVSCGGEGRRYTHARARTRTRARNTRTSPEHTHSKLTHTLTLAVVRRAGTTSENRSLFRTRSPPPPADPSARDNIIYTHRCIRAIMYVGGTRRTTGFLCLTSPRLLSPLPASPVSPRRLPFARAPWTERDSRFPDRSV